jgi:putative nucleotidyltransferase with HDIG domain
MESILAKLKTLPALPEIVYQLTKLIDDPNSTAQDLAEVISKDQSLTARVLRLVNSSYYAFRSKISKVSHAISLMGFLSIKNIVLSLSVIDAFRKRERDDGLEHHLFWEHSIGTASAAQSLGERSGYLSPEEAFVGGLLHDIGKVVFDMTSPKEYAAALRQARIEGRTIRSVEKDYFGFDHAGLGAALAEQWGLPSQLQDSIRSHHDEQPETELAAIVSVANTLCKARQVGFSGDSLIEHIQDELVRQFDVSKETMGKIFLGLKHEVRMARIFFGLDDAEPKAPEDEEGDDQNQHGYAVFVASDTPRLVNLPQLILEAEDFRVRPSGIPIRMGPDEKRETGMIVIVAEGKNDSYPEEIEVKISEAVTRRIPTVRLTSPFTPHMLIDLVRLPDRLKAADIGH